MPNIQSDDFTLTIAAGWNNIKTLIEAGTDVTVISYKWSMLAISNTGGASCTIRRAVPNGTAPSTTTNGRNLAPGTSFVFDARHTSEIDGKNVWIYSAAGTTVDISIMRAGK